MNITWIDAGALEVTDGEDKKLGFPTGIPPRRFASADTVAVKRYEGILLNASGEAESWPLFRFIEHEGSIAALGPWQEGTKPFDASEADIADLLELLPALRILKTQSFPLNGLYLPAFRRLPGGGWLVFPPLLASFAREIHPEDKNHADWELWTHPDLTGEEAWSFSLGILSWRILTKEDPFGDETGESRRERIRKGFIPPIETEVPAINPEASLFIRSALCGGTDGRPALDDWEHFLKKWSENGLLLELSEPELEQRRSQALRKAEESNRRLRLRRWFRRSGWKLISIIGGIAAFAAVVSGPIKHALEIPVTSGMQPLEVAEAYYKAIDDLDLETMDDCLAKKVGKEDTRLVEMVFVTHKVRQGYEHLGDLPRASEWLAAGKPELQQGIRPWGITDLRLTEMKDGRIEARYQLWAPQETAEGMEPEGIPRTDILTFTEGRRSWEISGMERSQSKVIE